MIVEMVRILVIAIAFSGCYRGCNYNSGPAQSCDDTSDCTHGGTCRGGSCLDSNYVAVDDACHARAACSESGACDAVRVRSFLGANPAFECGATTDEECRQSHQCTTRGACSRIGPDDEVGCGAATAMNCLVSERCLTHEECKLDRTYCARDWTTCPVMPKPEAPSWADRTDLVWEFDSLRGPWQPGNVESATLACKFETKHRGYSALRIAGRCTEGPGNGTWLRAEVPLHIGDQIAVTVQRDQLGYWSDGFAKLAYTGESPMRGGGEEPFECVVVPHDIALDRSKRELAAVDRELAFAAREQPELHYPQVAPSGVEAARVHAERAAMWLGWTDPVLRTRVANIEAALAAYATRLDKAIRAQPALATFSDREFSITVLGRVCGAALNARVATATDDCAVELEIENVSGRSMNAWLSNFAWLRRSRADRSAAVVPTKAIEVRVDNHRVETDSPQLAPGQRATVLVGGFEDDALLAGRLDSAFILKP